MHVLEKREDRSCTRPTYPHLPSTVPLAVVIAVPICVVLLLLVVVLVVAVLLYRRHVYRSKPFKPMAMPLSET